jgi:hypothetical protein
MPVSEAALGAVRLAQWSGSLLDDSNGGAYVTAGTLVCLVGDPARITAVMLVGDTDVKRLQPGQPARLRLEQLPGQVIEGEVIDVSRHDARASENSETGPADLDQLFAGVVPPEQRGAFYRARIRLNRGADEGRGAQNEEQGSQNDSSSVAVPRFPALIMGGRGEAKVSVERITVARWIWRYFAQTFRLPM